MNKPGGGFLPKVLFEEIDELGDRIELEYNWGTYKCGMAGSQADYDDAMKKLFGLLDEMEERLQDKPFLFGDHITEADLR